MNLNLDTIILYVKDVERLKTFYVDIFKLAIAEEYQSVWVLLLAGNGKIGLHQMGNEYLIKTGSATKFENNCKLVFEIDEDLETARERLLALGVHMRAIKTFTDYNYWLCDGEDPEGNVFQLKKKK